ncbi:Trafficking protein particle complex subunit 6B [Cytospora mali]|uniref:Trafficking protein particle complex subunit 6B n=1 Tax=Cytospora mali TaxID=578113 RepID=A0A194VA94_CYTMA|nr:Trafficking protein particle complex subunit 6B [Valsa mali var. pyri (nom. inval.)]
MSFDAVMPPYNASDPHATFLNSSCFDFLLIELVPMAYRVTNELEAAAAANTSVPPGSATTTNNTGQQGLAADNKDVSSVAGTGTMSIGTGTGTGAAGSKRVLDEEEERDAVFYRLETLGYRVGQGLVERKQVDNLKTNHRGVYVLTDNAFRPFSRMSTEAGGQAVLRAEPFLWFPCGIVRGALAAMGINATVQAETSELPGAVFQIKTVPTK